MTRVFVFVWFQNGILLKLSLITCTKGRPPLAHFTTNVFIFVWFQKDGLGFNLKLDFNHLHEGSSLSCSKVEQFPSHSWAGLSISLKFTFSFLFYVLSHLFFPCLFPFAPFLSLSIPSHTLSFLFYPLSHLLFPFLSPLTPFLSFSTHFPSHLFFCNLVHAAKCDQQYLSKLFTIFNFFSASHFCHISWRRTAQKRLIKKLLHTLLSFAVVLSLFSKKEWQIWETFICSCFVKMLQCSLFPCPPSLRAFDSRLGGKERSYRRTWTWTWVGGGCKGTGRKDTQIWSNFD